MAAKNALPLRPAQAGVPRPSADALGRRPRRSSPAPGGRRLLFAVDVAQRLAAAVVATLVATIALTEVRVTRTVGAVRRLGGRKGGLSGRRDGYLVLVELQ
jgi:hypothetical protein